MAAPMIRVNGGAPPQEPLPPSPSSSNWSDGDEEHPELDDHGRPVDPDGVAALLRRYGIKHADVRLKTFWPYALLQRILTKQRVVEVLQNYAEMFPDVYRERNLDDDMRTILGETTADKRYIKVFATLLYCGKGQAIAQFINAEVSDDDIPLVEYTDEAYNFLLRRGKTQAVGVPVALDCFNEWQNYERESFETWQHRFDVAFLGLNPDKTIRHVEIASHVILPWTAYKSYDHEQGGYSRVYRARIPSNSHGFHDVLRAITFRNCFAVKELKDKDEKRLKENEVHFWKEVNMLKRFNGRSHDHLVTLLMTWRMDDRHYFLFPAAECDLLSYWEDKHPTVDFTDTLAIQWLSAQIRGMTEALAVIHNPTRLLEEQQRFGRHGDLKAENILWYPSNDYKRGIFVIADFGLGALNTEKSRSNIPGETIPTTPGYRPPECDLEGGLISRSFDVWTFGCLLLEMICWALGGNQLRAKFENDRMTPYITGSNSYIFFDIQYLHNSGREKRWAVKVKEVVTKWISELHNHSACTKYYHDLLDLIEDEMIIVLSSGPPMQKRISSIDLSRKINKMHSKINDPQYAQEPCPKRRNAKNIVAFECKLNKTAERCVMGNGGAALDVHRGDLRKSMTPTELRALNDREVL